MRTPPIRTLVVLSCACALLLTACPAPFTLGFPGQLPTKKWNVVFDSKYPEVTIFYPDTPASESPAPVVVFSTGWNQPRGSYEGYAKQLAQWGYVCVIRFLPSLGLRGVGNEMFEEHADHVSTILDWLTLENERPESPLYHKVDANNAGVTGHSMGASVSFIAATQDPRIKAMVSLDIKYTNPNINHLMHFENSYAAFMIIGTDDTSWCGIPPGSEQRLYDLISSPAAEVTILGGDHIDFEDSLVLLDYFALIACPGGYADAQDVRDIATRYMVAWFNVYLGQDTKFRDYFDGTRAQQDIEQRLVRIRLNQAAKAPAE